MANGATVTINQPQIAEWPNEAAVTFYAAASYAAEPIAKPALGTIVVEANTSVAFRRRLVRFSRFSVVDVNFPTLTKGEVREVIAMIPEFLDRPGVLGIGEIGLNKNTRNEATVFLEHLDLAARTQELIVCSVRSYRRPISAHDSPTI